MPTCRPASRVTEDPAFAGQFWTRIYGRRRGFPQVISSSKRFAGPTGLEEQVGGGIGIALRVEVEDGALHFLSDHYFLMLRGRRLRLPRFLSPGALRVSHIDCNNGLFAFVLALRHPWFGELVHQTAMFRERGGGGGSKSGAHGPLRSVGEGLRSRMATRRHRCHRRLALAATDNSA